MPGKKFKRKVGVNTINKEMPITVAGHKYAGKSMRGKLKGTSYDPHCWCGFKHSANPTTRDTPELFEPFKPRKQREGENYKKRGKKK